MKNQEINLTTAQFAAIHEVNPRTLHYYCLLYTSDAADEL